MRRDGRVGKILWGNKVGVVGKCTESEAASLKSSMVWNSVKCIVEGYATAWVPKKFPILKNIVRKMTSLVCTKEYYKTILIKSGECRVDAECGLSFKLLHL